MVKGLPAHEAARASVRQEGREQRRAPDWEQGHLLLGGDAEPTGDSPFFVPRIQPPPGPPPSHPKLPWKPESRRTKSGRWNSHLRRPHCLVSITHTQVPWPQRGFGQAAGEQTGKTPGSSCPGLLGALGTALTLQAQSPHLNSVVWAGSHFSFTCEEGAGSLVSVWQPQAG